MKVLTDEAEQATTIIVVAERQSFIGSIYFFVCNDCV
jgi:hypothetical protein